jgi:hypothetical protein
MPRFRINNFTPAPIPDGVYLVKVISVKEKTSEARNEMIVMRLGLPDGRELPACLTFVPKAEMVINAFCHSADLTKPTEGEALLTAADCLGRYLYIVVSNDVGDHDSEPLPHVSRFITHEAALIKNPKLAKVQLREPAPRQLKAAY